MYVMVVSFECNVSQLLRLHFSTLESVVYFDRGPSDGDSAEHFGKMGDCVMVEMRDRQRAVYRARGTAERAENLRETATPTIWMVKPIR